MLKYLNLFDCFVSRLTPPPLNDSRDKFMCHIEISLVCSGVLCALENSAKLKFDTLMLIQ